MTSVAADAIFAVRTLRRRPAFTLVAIATLALGIGAATAIFTVVDGILLRPLSFPGGARLTTVWQTDTRYRDQSTLRQRWDRLWFTYPEFQRWRAEQRSFSATALYGQQQMALTGAGDPAEIEVFTATPSLLPLLGTAVAHGRWFEAGEEGTGTTRLAVLSHELWTARYGADPAAVGRSIALDDRAFIIVGVLPPGFRMPSLTASTRKTADVWIPVGSDGGGQAFDSSYEVIGRLREGVTVAAASAEADRIVRSFDRAERGARALPRLEAETAAVRKPLLLVAAGVVILLLIACANVATLLLGEMPGRAREIATRTALGASRLRIARQLITESVILAAAGGAAGVLVARWSVHALVALAPADLPRVQEAGVDVRVLAFSMLLVLGTAICFGLAPAVSAARTGAAATHAGDRIARGTRDGWQRLTMVAQFALALVLLASAGLLAKSLHLLLSVDPGYRTGRVLAMSVTPPASRYSSPAAVRAYFERLEERLAAIPGVTSVGSCSSPPLSGRNPTGSVEIEGVVSSVKPSVGRRSISPGYFAALGIPLRAGRLFTAADPPSDPSMIVDEEMARRLWPGDSPIGRRVRVFNNWLTVVGVVGSVRQGRLDEAEQPTYYVPHSLIATREMTLVIHTSGDPLAVADAVRQTAWSIDPLIPLADLSTMDARVERSASPERYRTRLLGAFAAAAALLTSTGIFGVTARGVSRRRRELGIRLALGADRWSVVRTVMGRQGREIVFGLVIGLAAVRAATPILRGFVFGVSPFDAATLVSAAMALLALAAAAAYLPARQAARIDPLVSMRSE